MQRILILIILTVLSATLFGQYKKLPLDTNHVWQEYCDFHPGVPGKTDRYQWRVTQEILINGKTYSILTLKGSTCYFTQMNFALYIRQDTVLKQVFIFNGNHEELLFDFSKNVGDTMQSSCYGSPVTYTLITKDSLLLNDGLYHKRFNWGSGTPFIIEGVGSTNGWLNPYCMMYDGYTMLECLARLKPKLGIYGASSAGATCLTALDLLKEKFINQNKIAVFPNPSTGLINVFTGNVIPESIEILNSIGQRVLYINEFNNVKISLDFGGFSPGLYFVKVNFTSQTIGSHIIKN